MLLFLNIKTSARKTNTESKTQAKRFAAGVEDMMDKLDDILDGRFARETFQHGVTDNVGLQTVSDPGEPAIKLLTCKADLLTLLAMPRK